ncbi:MAG: hypothetical protein ABJB40_05460, partial [Acidobacteriota bacterium]
LIPGNFACFRQAEKGDAAVTFSVGPANSRSSQLQRRGGEKLSPSPCTKPKLQKVSNKIWCIKMQKAAVEAAFRFA